MNNLTKLLRICAELFEVPVETLSEATSQDDVETWDSLAMVNLIAEVESLFEVRFDLLEIAEFRSIGRIKEVLARKGIPF